MAFAKSQNLMFTLLRNFIKIYIGDGHEMCYNGAHGKKRCCKKTFSCFGRETWLFLWAFLYLFIEMSVIHEIFIQI